MKKIRILSIDGGGIRGILPGVIVAYLEELLQKITGNKDKRISDYFDLIAGTSTGGILTCIYLIPGENNRAKYTAQQALEMYLTRGDEIFNVSLWQRIRSGNGILDEKYSAKPLEEAMDDYFGTTKLSDLLKPCLITAYDIRNRKAMFYNSVKAKQSKELKNFYVKDIARATSAAPTYFEPARIKSIFGAPYPLIDGGVFANNPAMCAYAEARRLAFESALNMSNKPDYPTANNMYMVSIGTGSQKQPYYYDQAKDWGVISWLKPIIDILMSGNSETVHYQLNKLFSSVEGDKNNNYIRLEPQLINGDNDMDNGKLENLKALESDGKIFVEKNEKTLKTIAENLINNE